MPRFSVPVVRIGYSQQQIEVESDDQEAANTLALERAPSEDFSEHDSEYRLAMKDENAIWIVCHRRFDHGQVALSAFSSEDKACRHAARIIADELDVLVGLDDRVGPPLVKALRDERHEDAVQLYHSVEGNNDSIDVICAEVDEHDSGQPICASAIII